MVLFYTNICITIGLVLTAIVSPTLDYQAAFALAAKDNAAIANGEYWRLLTAFFINTPLVLFINMYSLNAIARAVEKFYSGWLFLGTYLTGGIMSILASYWLTDAMSFGAGGAIAAVFGLFFGFIQRYKNISQLIMPGIREELFKVIGINVIFILLSVTWSWPIDVWMIIAGFFTGWAIFVIREFVRSTQVWKNLSKAFEKQ